MERLWISSSHQVCIVAQFLLLLISSQRKHLPHSPLHATSSRPIAGLKRKKLPYPWTEFEEAATDAQALARHRLCHLVFSSPVSFRPKLGENAFRRAVEQHNVASTLASRPFPLSSHDRWLTLQCADHTRGLGRNPPAPSATDERSNVPRLCRAFSARSTAAQMSVATMACNPTGLQPQLLKPTQPSRPLPVKMQRLLMQRTRP